MTQSGRVLVLLTILATLGCVEKTGTETAAIEQSDPPAATILDQPEPQVSDRWLQSRLDQIQASHPDVPGFAMTVIHRDHLSSAATGVADPAGRAMTAGTPVRQASISKTLVAASILRLFEMGQMELREPISVLITPRPIDLLKADGYEPINIRVRDLLMHSSVVNDHFGSERFTQAVLADPGRVWTRAEQLAFMTEATDPLEPNPRRFSYSDSGYLLLGEAIEVLTGLPLGDAVAELNRFDALGLTESFWEGQGREDRVGPARAHQFLDGIDTFGIHGSVDAFGGGGWVASTDDVARYFNALFEGSVFDQGETLDLMIEAPGRPVDSPYRIGLFERVADGISGYGHGGFWGTDVVAYPELELVIAGVALESSAVDAIRELGEDLVRDLNQ